MKLRPSAKSVFPSGTPQAEGAPHTTPEVNMSNTPVVGRKYNWQHQKERLEYMGCSFGWHQFSLVDKPNVVWCEVLGDELEMIVETKD
jgi:hypothetical protein